MIHDRPGATSVWTVISNPRESMTLRIQKSDDREVVAFALTGHIEKEHTVELQRLIDGEENLHNITIDLKEVKLIDRDSVRFLMRCERDGIKLENCPAHIREWIVRERTETTRY